MLGTSCEARCCAALAGPAPRENLEESCSSRSKPAGMVKDLLIITVVVCLTPLPAPGWQLLGRCSRRVRQAHLALCSGLQVVQAPQSELLSRFTSSVNQGLVNTRALVYGPAESFGVFEQGTGFGIASGVVISTGRISDISSSKPSHDYPDDLPGRKETGDAAAFAIMVRRPLAYPAYLLSSLSSVLPSS